MLKTFGAGCEHDSSRDQKEETSVAACWLKDSTARSNDTDNDSLKREHIILSQSLPGSKVRERKSKSFSAVELAETVTSVD